MHDLLIIDNIDKIISKHNLEEKLFILINDFILNKKYSFIGALKKIFDKKNIARKDCLLLPFKAVSKALKL